MKVIIAGSRGLSGVRLIGKAIAASGWLMQIEEVVSGTTNGVDKSGERWAEDNQVKVKRFPADWKNLKGKDVVVKEGRFGKYNARAGQNRNQKMAEYEYADALRAVRERRYSVTHPVTA